MIRRLNNFGIDFKYLLVNSRDKQFGLWINTVGFQSIQKGVVYPPKDHPSAYFFNASKGRVLHEYQLVYITKGEGWFESENTKKTNIEKGCLIMLFPGQWHTYSPLLKTGWNEYYIGFDGPIMDSILQTSFFTKEDPILRVGFHENLVNLFMRAIETAKEDKFGAQQYLAGVVMHILGKVLSISKNKIFDSNEVNQKIERAKIIMNENVYNNIDPEQVAEKLNISYSWFRKVFKGYTGYAPAQYFQEIKINKAKHLLAETSLSVKEIAFQLNYNSTEHFFSIFKKKTGFTPIAYRNYERGTE
ncbi:MAG: AraC family transcriptional regulator [Dysgonomonas sp.]